MPDQWETVCVPVWAGGGAWALRQRDLDGCQALWQGSPYPLLPSEHHNMLQNHPSPCHSTNPAHYSLNVQHPDKLQEAPRVHGSQENQKGCSYILLLSLGQKVCILIFRQLCVVFLLHIHSSAQSRECWAHCSTSWAPIPWALLHGTWNKAMSLDCT